MFESEDFDFDEDILEDIDKKEEEYFSQKIDIVANDPPAKRQKTESLDFDLFSDITFDDEPDFAKIIPKTSETSPETSVSELDDVSSRRKRILAFFNTNSDSIHSQNEPRQNAKSSPSLHSLSQKSQDSPLPSKNMEASRKALALEILRKGSLEKDSNQITVKTSPPKSLKNREAPTIRNNNQSNQNFAAETFKKPAERSSELSKKFPARNSPKFPSRDRSTSAPKMTLVRRFPGPAGLLPDNLESNLDHANFLNSLGDFGVDENHEDSKISDYCSQNTERLFTSGAWRSMLDDLPANFLRGQEIATIKRFARDSSEKTKVSFVAGVIQRIDQSFENPRLLLKDMTDSIEATMHSDIPLAHPNVLEPGVVILLRDVGLLDYRGSQKCPGLQYHLMISPSNVLAVYSEKTRLISSPWMDSINKATRNSSVDECSNFSANSEEKDGNERKVLSERNAGLFENMEISDFDSEDEEKAFGFFNLGDITDSQTSSSFLKAGTNFKSKSPVVRNLETDKSRADWNCKAATKIEAGKSMGDKNGEKIEEEKKNDLPSEEIVIKPKTIVGVRSRLLQFRSNDLLTPPVTETKVAEHSTSNNSIASCLGKKNKEDENNCNASMRTFADDLLASDEDTEDEILSQLDVESIMTNYNASS